VNILCDCFLSFWFCDCEELTVFGSIFEIFGSILKFLKICVGGKWVQQKKFEMNAIGFNGYILKISHFKLFTGFNFCGDIS